MEGIPVPVGQEPCWIYVSKILVDHVSKTKVDGSPKIDPWSLHMYAHMYMDYLQHTHKFYLINKIKTVLYVGFLIYYFSEPFITLLRAYKLN